MGEIIQDALGRWAEKLPAGGVGGGVSHFFHRLLTEAEVAFHLAPAAPPASVAPQEESAEQPECAPAQSQS